MNPESSYKHIANSFRLSDNIRFIKNYGSGHIHDTFLVETTYDKYILQKVNQHVFKNIPQLMSNINKVTTHIQQKTSVQYPTLKFLKLIKTIDGNFYFKDDADNYWRMYNFICDSF